MICPKCSSKLNKVMVSIEDAKTKALSYQCPNCDYIAFEPKSSIKIITEINRQP